MSEAEIGKWKLTAVCPCLAVSSGVVALRDKYGGLDFSLDYDYLMGEIKKRPSRKTIVMRKRSFVSLAKALQNNQWDKLGDIEEITRTIDLVNPSVKRVYNEDPKDGGDLLERKFYSEPLDISLINVKEVQ